MNDFRKYNNGPTVDPELIRLENDMIIGCSGPRDSNDDSKDGCENCELKEKCRRVFDNYVTPDQAYYRMTPADALRIRKHLRKIGCTI